MSLVLSEKLSSHITHHRIKSSCVLKGVTLQNELPISKSSDKRRFQLALATFEKSTYLVTYNEENWFCVVPSRNLKNVLIVNTSKYWWCILQDLNLQSSKSSQTRGYELSLAILKS